MTRVDLPNKNKNLIMKKNVKVSKSILDFQDLKVNNLKVIFGGLTDDGKDGDIDPPMPKPTTGPDGGLNGPR